MSEKLDPGPGQPRLLADIGGTNARFALQTGPSLFAHVEVLACGAYATLGDAMRAYVASAAARGFAPANGDEMAILALLWSEFDHVSAERLLSGMSLELIHRALTDRHVLAADITARALIAACAECRRSIDTFCAILGSVAGNVALTLGATGGMYIGGGIVPRLGSLFAQSAFRRRFEDKGRLGPYLARIPTYLITEPYPALPGVAAMLADHLAQAT